MLSNQTKPNQTNEWLLRTGGIRKQYQNNKDKDLHSLMFTFIPIFVNLIMIW